MNPSVTSREQELLRENESLRRRVAELEAREARREKAVQVRTAGESPPKDILDCIQEVVSYLDRDFSIVWANETAGRLSGKPLEEALGRKCYEVAQGRDSPCEGCLAIEALETGEYTRGEFSTPDGKTWLMSVSPVRDGNGEIEGVLTTTLDVTERRQAEKQLAESESRYRRLFDVAALGIFRSTPEGRLISVNPDFARKFGYGSPQEFLAESPRSDELFADAGDRGRLVGYLLESRGPICMENRYRRKDGKVFIGQLHAWKVETETGEVYFEGFVRDVTEVRQAERRLKLYAAELDSQKRLLEAVFNTIPDVIGVQRLDHGMLRYNKAGYDLLGIGPEEVAGRKCYELIGRDSECAPCATSMALKKNESVSIEKYVPEVGVHLHCISTPVKGADGEPVMIVEQLRDITARKRAEEALKESEERFRLLFTQSPLGIVRYDAEGVITDANEAFAEMMSARREKIIGMNIFKAARDEKLKEITREALAGGNGVFEGEYRSVAGDRTAHLRVVSGPIFSAAGKVVGGMSITEDVSERKRMEAALVTAKEQAEAASRAKSEFLANMSHEIRTPLNGVMGMLQLLETTRLDQEQGQYVSTALGSGRSLLTVINDILDFSKVEAGKIELAREPFALREVMDTVLETFRHQIESRRVTLTDSLHEEVPPRLVGDGGRLRQILFNLVGNAVKFTDAGEILVAVRRGEAVDGRVCLEFTVSDTGVGIEPEKLASVFEPFTQSDGSLSRKYQGTGLGLSIVKRLVGLMGGEIDMKSEPGAGTQVTFSLYLEALQEDEPRRAPVPGKSAKAGTSTLRVLVADDNSVSRTLATRLIEKAGHSAEAVENGREACEALRGGGFDLVLMDVQMPVMDGLEAVRLIRGGPDGIDPEVPVVAMTAHAMKGDREEFLEAGMSGYLPKPIDAEELNELLAGYAGAPANH